MSIFDVHPKPWKVEVNPFGKNEKEEYDNIFITNADGYPILIITKHPVWNHMENVRLEVAEYIVKLINSEK